MNRQRGFALIIVLWTVGLLSLLVGQFTSAGRAEIQVAANLRANAVAEAAADGAINEAILRLLQNEWQPDGTPHQLAIGPAVVDVAVLSEARKLNPNSASPAALQALLARVGIAGAQAAGLARAMTDWRSGTSRAALIGPKFAPYLAAALPYGPPGQPFASLDELGLVIGMTPALLARLKPFLSLYQEGDAAEDSGNLLFGGSESAASSGWFFGSTGRLMVVMIEAVAAVDGGARFTRQAVVRLRGEATLDQEPYQILTWDSPTD